MTKVVWSKNAKQELLAITSFWDKKNKSKTYSEKIKFHIELAINLIKKNKKLGIRSNIESVRMRLILKNYYLVYEISENQINILQFWDVRQNPIKISYDKK
jgi:plasmid stabilization system protein ParE